MCRFGSFALFTMIFLVLSLDTAANPPDDPFQKTVAVQSAMSRANSFLLENNGQKAVEILEQQLPKVNGNADYLVLLRKAYRVYIKDLYLAGQHELAQRYLDRLCILDPMAASDATLRPQADMTPKKFEPEPVKPAEKTAYPKFKLSNAFVNPFAKKEEPKTPAEAKPKVFRARSDDSSVEDPFDRKFQRDSASDTGKAQQLLTRGAEEFAQKRYTEARMYFAQACQSDQTCLEACREQWAYCIIKGAADSLDQPGNPPAKLIEWQQEVERAIRMSSTKPKMAAKGQEILLQLDQRSKLQGGAAPQVFASNSTVTHRGKNREGWQVAETPHFRIFHRQNDEYAERVAQVAEQTRTAMYRKWFDQDGVEWEPKCELILHPSAASYTQMTAVPANSPGHSRIESDPSGRVIARRMDLRNDIHGMMDAVLPHEATHVVLAGMFGSAPVPRWADEGIAVLSEPEEKIEQHRRNLLKNHQEGHLFGLRELMELKDYPLPRRISAFYAQSVVLVEFMTNRRGAKVFTDFMQDGVRYGYETALQRHYQLTFAQLDQLWQQQVISNTDRYAAKR